jgi:hypothetical protein
MRNTPNGNFGYLSLVWYHSRTYLIATHAIGIEPGIGGICRVVINAVESAANPVLKTSKEDDHA